MELDTTPFALCEEIHANVIVPAASTACAWSKPFGSLS
jgi:hypothetical protein